MARLNRDAEQLAARFQLRYRAVEAERPNVKRRYGVCFSDGTIRIRLRHVVTRKPLKYSSLVNTLCHELAHLRHFNHGPRFKAFYLKILEYARTEGLYRPGPPRETPARSPERPPSPPRVGAEQLSLFWE
jgi:predicted metal-dependent hydrolase